MIFNPTARKVGEGFEITYCDMPEPNTAYTVMRGFKEAYMRWLSSAKTVKLKPEFNSEFKQLLDGPLTLLNAAKSCSDELTMLPEGMSIDHIKHRIGIVCSCPELECDLYHKYKDSCDYVAILLPEVKEERQADIWHDFFKKRKLVSMSVIMELFTITRNK